MSLNQGKFIIAIDGPTASGKGTVAKLLAKEFGIITLSTGKIYRAICIYFMEHKIAPTDIETITKKIETVKIEVLPSDGNTRVKIAGKDVTERLDHVETSENVASYAKIPVVRTRVKSIQKELADEQSLVCEGRDITSVVFPNAEFKFYLTASLHARAKRRFKQEQEEGEQSTYEQVYRGIRQRDKMDMTREISPLKRVKDAKVINSTHLTAIETVEKMAKYIRKTHRKHAKRALKRNIPLDFKPPFGHNLFRIWLKSWAWWAYRIICPTKIINKREVTKHRGNPIIFAMNHRSNSDVAALFVHFSMFKFHFIGKDTLFKPHTFNNWFLRSLNGIPLRPGTDLAVIRHVLKVLESGESLSIFPEGRRNFNSEDALSVRDGTAVMSLKSGCPIVPMVSNRAPRPFRMTKLKVGNTIYPKDFKNKTELSNALRDELARLLDGFEHQPKRKKWDLEPIVNVRGIVIQENKLLLLKRVKNNQTYYVFPGGHVDEGETPRDATPREVKEETNIDCSVTRLLYKSRLVTGNQIGQIQGFYLCNFKSGTPSRTNAEEYTCDPNSTGWDGTPRGTFEPLFIDINEIKNLDIRPVAIRNKLLKDIKKYGIRLTRLPTFVK